MAKERFHSKLHPERNRKTSDYVAESIIFLFLCALCAGVYFAAAGS